VVEKTPEVVEKTPEVVEKTPEVVEKTPEVVEKTPEVVEKTPEVVEKTPEVVEKTPEVVEKTPEVAEKIKKTRKKNKADTITEAQYNEQVSVYTNPKLSEEDEKPTWSFSLIERTDDWEERKIHLTSELKFKDRTEVNVLNNNNGTIEVIGKLVIKISNTTEEDDINFDKFQTNNEDGWLEDDSGSIWYSSKNQQYTFNAPNQESLVKYGIVSKYITNCIEQDELEHDTGHLYLIKIIDIEFSPHSLTSPPVNKVKTKAKPHKTNAKVAGAPRKLKSKPIYTSSDSGTTVVTDETS
jgi:hypothetical protein